MGPCLSLPKRASTKCSWSGNLPTDRQPLLSSHASQNDREHSTVEVARAVSVPPGSLPKHYAYTPLHKTNASSEHTTPNYIRLFKLKRGRYSDPLRGSLRTVPVSRITRKYEALSYVWGSPERYFKIECDGRCLLITKSLDVALRRLRYKFSPRTLWIDAICINQDDPAERGHQVKLMKDVYAVASQVLIWLGEEREEDRGALDMVRWLSEEIIHLRTKPRPGPEIPSERSLVRILLESRVKSESCWRALMALGEREYFRRIWTVQEMVLAQTGLLILGSSSLENHNLLNISSSCDYGFPEICRFFNWNVADTRRFRNSWDGVNGIGRLIHPVGRSLLCALYYTVNKETSDGRDHVYGLLGLIDPELVETINVSYTLCIEDVMQEVTLQVLAHEKCLDIISCMPTLVHRNYGVSKMPSWVFDWAKSGPALPPCSVQSTRHFSASRDSRLQLKTCDSDAVICLEGLLVDRVDQIDHAHDMLGRLRWAMNTICPSTKKDRNDDMSRSGRLRLKEILKAWNGICCCAGNGGCARLTRSFQSWINTVEELEALLCDLEMHVDFQPTSEQYRLFTGISELLFCKTTNAHLGVVTPCAKPGDVIVVLYGGRLPFLVRPCNDGRYIWLGEAYVSGLMYGEAMDMNISEQTFLIK